MHEEKLELIYNYIDRTLHPDIRMKTFTTIEVEINKQFTTIEIEKDFLDNTDEKTIKEKLTELNLSQMIEQSDGKTIRVLSDKIVYLNR